MYRRRTGGTGEILPAVAKTYNSFEGEETAMGDAAGGRLEGPVPEEDRMDRTV